MTPIEIHNRRIEKERQAHVVAELERLKADNKRLRVDRARLREQLGAQT